LNRKADDLLLTGHKFYNSTMNIQEAFERGFSVDFISDKCVVYFFQHKEIHRELLEYLLESSTKFKKILLEIKVKDSQKLILAIKFGDDDILVSKEIKYTKTKLEDFINNTSENKEIGFFTDYAYYIDEEDDSKFIPAADNFIKYEWGIMLSGYTIAW
jgi:hypothetical protein